LVGGLFKGFVRGSDDPENPYSKEYPSVLLRFVYFLFFFLIAVFVFICSGRIDQKIPFTTDPFPAISYWIVFIPLFIAFAMLFVVFCFKGVIAWNLFLKGDENRDGPLLAMTYSTICIYLILNIITCILFSVRNDLPSVKQVNFSPALCLLPTAVGHVLLFVISICPFFPNFKKQITADDEEKQEYELLTFL
jgi:energy-coupling factor transporter transmembrane protein EcfT